MCCVFAPGFRAPGTVTYSHFCVGAWPWVAWPPGSWQSNTVTFFFSRLALGDRQPPDSSGRGNLLPLFQFSFNPKQNPGAFFSFPGAFFFISWCFFFISWCFFFHLLVLFFCAPDCTFAGAFFFICWCFFCAPDCAFAGAFFCAPDCALAGAFFSFAGAFFCAPDCAFAGAFFFMFLRFLVLLYNENLNKHLAIFLVLLIVLLLVLFLCS